MNSQEWRSTGVLSAINVLRMLGMLMILPVLGLYARQLPGGAAPWQVGLALAAFGLVQAVLQIPFGILSDRFGRKPLILLGTVMFILGGLVAAWKPDIIGITLGRAIQGSGAITGVLSALLSDGTRTEARTQAMAVFGACTAISFIVAVVIGPLLEGLIGVPGIFMLTAIGGLISLPVIAFGVAAPPIGQPAEGGIGEILADPFMQRMNIGAFLLNFMLTGLFAAIPFAIESTFGLQTGTQWKFYLPVLLSSLLLTLPLIRRSRKNGGNKPMFLGMIALSFVSMAVAGVGYGQSILLILAMVAFFISFCFLGASMPAAVSQRADPARRGAALGVFSTAQILGAALGNIVCNGLRGTFDLPGMFIALAIVPLIWLAVVARHSIDPKPQPASVV